MTACPNPVVSGATHSGRGWPSKRHDWIVYGEEDTTDTDREGTLWEPSLFTLITDG